VARQRAMALHRGLNQGSRAQGPGWRWEKVVLAVHPDPPPADRPRLKSLEASLLWGQAVSRTAQAPPRRGRPEAGPW